MVLNSTDISYRYPTPVSPKPPPQKKPSRKGAPVADPPQQAQHLAASPSRPHAQAQPRAHVHIDSQPQALPRPQASAQTSNDVAARQNAGVQVVIPKSTPLKKTLVPAVVIPGLPPSSQRTDYEQFPEVDEEVRGGDVSPSKKRKRESRAEEAPAISFDQREKSDAASRSLQGLIADIFEAEDQLQPDTSGVVSSHTTKLFVSGTVGESEVPILEPSVQLRLDSAVQKAISVGRFSDVPAEHLARVQKLCEAAASAVDSASLIVGNGWSEGDVEEWASRLDGTTNGLQAAKTLVRIMAAGREERQLYSEDLLQSVLNALKHVLDSCVIPVAEARQSDADSDLFKTYSAQKKSLTTLVQGFGRVLKLLGDLLTKVDVSESAVTAVEFVSTRLIFVENAHSEKDSILGVQRFETLRRTAMDALAQIFARYSDQRTFIFDEILTSLEKLPVTRQSARQFKLVENKPIQLVSALLMRLIQTSASPSIKKRQKSGNEATATDGDDDDECGSEADPTSLCKKVQATKADAANMDADTAIQELADVVKPLYDGAQQNAHYLVKFMTQRALSATKTGDQPYRNLLDIFTEDFINVLGSTDWPAAEMFLRTLLSHLIGIMENEKSTAPAKNMALDLMGLMGSGISDLQIHVRQSVRSLNINESELSANLVPLVDDILDDKPAEMDMLDFAGPRRAVVEYLQSRDVDDLQLQSARGYVITQWARDLLSAYETSDDEDAEWFKELAIKLRNMVVDSKWLEAEYDFEPVTTVQGRVSSALIALSLPLSKAFKRIFSILLTSMSSDQATVKSRALKSVVQLLEKDPSILDRGTYVLSHILRCAADSSPLVRDSALGLLSKCLTLRPSLEDEVYERVVARSADAAIGVRKRAMKVLREIYLRNQSKEIKSAVADALLQRIKDTDESVADLARQTFEEMWMSPFHAMLIVKDDVQAKLALKGQVALIVKTATRGESVLSVLHALLQSVLSNDSKNAAANFQVCKAMVAMLFDAIIDNDELPDKPSQKDILQTLTVFAKANAKLFTGEQLELLEPYVKNLSNTDDLLVYRSVIAIFRHVLPSLSSFQNTFLQAVQNALLSNVAKLGKKELSEVASCLWIIDSVLKNTDRLVRLMVSVLHGIYSAKDTDFADANQTPALNRVKRYAMIAGYLGRACNLDDHPDAFKTKFPWWKGTSIAGLVVDILCPLTRQSQPHSLREIVLESIAMVCQAWPKQYLRTDVTTAFELVFHNRDARLEHVVLAGFKGFFDQEETRSETGAEIAVGAGTATGTDRLAVSYAVTDNDGASPSIAQRFLQYILRIALETTDDVALAATQVIASINRQGLVHPKECGPSLVALETSPNTAIANIAFMEHRTLHHKHETMFEKEYMRAVHQAFLYQRDIVHSPEGAKTQPFASKLAPLFEVLRTGNAKVRKRFLANLCSRIDLDMSKLDATGDHPTQLLFARFCVENLAFFEYDRLDDILHTVTCIEKIVTTTGAPVAHAIETEVLKVQLEAEKNAEGSQMLNGQAYQQGTVGPDHLMYPPPGAAQLPGALPAPINHTRLRELALASTILTMLWETRTYLRRQWGLQRAVTANAANSKAKTAAKDMKKAPTKASGVTGAGYHDNVLKLMTSLSALDSMLERCTSFVELLAIDNEVKVASDDDEEAELLKKAAGYDTPAEDDEKMSHTGSVAASGGGRGRKRKGSMSVENTPKKRRGRLPGSVKAKKGRKGRARSGSGGSADADGDWE
ncbi:hypothetical protein W97_00357 [Coniosporium apollinis CBS 100218]|uniref:Sister chromatid cohesion protein n=1 Tax=Coniosporium apollinis (strain CBS 100218) TaxID=1168221 RepID=R7YHP6_CONA1|nr:uncharacterized protein W97_00357 [Coniosporium apollinis CBS 100218]EON61146.1 hypothetical protein W97_00357 [Coniosporium apollinis CBS 100218]